MFAKIVREIYFVCDGKTENFSLSGFLLNVRQDAK